MPDERGRLTPEEETSHARRGACLAIIVVPIVLCCICQLFSSFTETGRAFSAHYTLYVIYEGIPVPIPFAEGLKNTARRGCELDRQNPRPANYQEDQENLKNVYDALIIMYNTSWQQLIQNKGDASRHEDPKNIPTDFNVAKGVYCR
jgi:hypothetical protein